MIQSAVDVKQIIETTNLFQVVTLRPFRERVSYPAVWIYNIESTDLKSASTDKTRYNGPWNIDLQIYSNFDNSKNADDTTDFEESEQLAKALLKDIMDTFDFELSAIRYFTARIAGKDLVTADISISSFKTLQL